MAQVGSDNSRFQDNNSGSTPPNYQPSATNYQPPAINYQPPATNYQPQQGYPIGANQNPVFNGNAGMVTNNGYVGTNFDLAITLSCFVVWFFNFIFGVIAFTLAIVGLSGRRPGNEANTGCMKRASLIVSFVGLILSVFIWLVALSVIVTILSAQYSRLYSNCYYSGNSYKCNIK